MKLKVDSKIVTLGLSILFLAGALFIVLYNEQQRNLDPVTENVSDEEFYRLAEEEKQGIIEQSNQLTERYYNAETLDSVREIYDQNNEEADVFIFTKRVATAAAGLNDRGEFNKALELTDQIIEQYEGENIHYGIYIQRYVAISENGQKEAPEVRKETVDKLFEIEVIDSREDPPDEFFFGIDEEAE